MRDNLSEIEDAVIGALAMTVLIFVSVDRVDDRFVELGRNALIAALAGKPVNPSRTQAVGCFIADMK